MILKKACWYPVRISYRVKGKLEMEERFMKRNEPIPKKKEFLQILREYEPYDKDHICILHRNSRRNAK